MHYNNIFRKNKKICFGSKGNLRPYKDGLSLTGLTSNITKKTFKK